MNDSDPLPMPGPLPPFHIPTLQPQRQEDHAPPSPADRPARGRMARRVAQPRRRPRCADAGGRLFESYFQSPRGSAPTSVRSGLNVPGRVAGSPVCADCGSKPRWRRPGPRGQGRTGQGCKVPAPPPCPPPRPPGAASREPGAGSPAQGSARRGGRGPRRRGGPAGTPPGHRPRRPGARRSQWRPRRRAGIGAGAGRAGGAGRGEEARRALSARL